MRILFAASEVAPFSRTGHLADVAKSLPIALAELGHEPIVVSPLHGQAHDAGEAIQPTSVLLDIPIGGRVVSGRLHESRLPGSDVPVYFIDQPEYFARREPYGIDGRDHKDNCERFTFFCRAVMELVRLLDLQADLVHCHDWQTGLIPALLRIDYRQAYGYEHLKSLLTIHNVAYQGQFWHWDMLLTGLDWRYFNWREMEFWGKLNLLKTGLVFADAITTVSPRYAEEIQMESGGAGLEGVIRQRRNELFGVINGIDYTVWNPATDPYLRTHYDVDTWRSGKSACKANLQREFELPVEGRTPVIALPCSLTDCQGWDLIAEVLPRWLEHFDAQWVVLGSGAPKYHALLRHSMASSPQRIAVRFDTSEHADHLLEAGADMILIPSGRDPGGLNQLRAMRYGTVPVVHESAVLADTVLDATPASLDAGRATGFSFSIYEATALEEALRRARVVFEKEPTIWSRLVETGMRQDWSWNRSARRYASLYNQVLSTSTAHSGALAVG